VCARAAAAVLVLVRVCACVCACVRLCVCVRAWSGPGCMCGCVGVPNTRTCYPPPSLPTLSPTPTFLAFACPASAHSAPPFSGVLLPGILPGYRTSRIYTPRQSIANAPLLRFIACCLRLDERTEGPELVGITAYISDVTPTSRDDELAPASWVLPTTRYPPREGPSAALSWCSWVQARL
jgi:hypothetical protein